MPTQQLHTAAVTYINYDTAAVACPRQERTWPGITTHDDALTCRRIGASYDVSSAIELAAGANA